MICHDCKKPITSEDIAYEAHGNLSKGNGCWEPVAIYVCKDCMAKTIEITPRTHPEAWKALEGEKPY